MFDGLLSPCHRWLVSQFIARNGIKRRKIRAKQRERERERERERDREREGTESERGGRERERAIEKDRQREGGRETDDTEKVRENEKKN